MSPWKFRLPKFSIAELLWITVAVAAGMAISRSPAKVFDTDTLFGIDYDFRPAYGLQAAGCLLLVMLLANRTWQLLRLPPPSTPELRTAWRLQYFTTGALSAGLALFVALRVLINRQVFILPEHNDMLSVWSEMCPDVLLLVASIASLLVFRPLRVLPNRRRLVASVINGVVSILILLFAGIVLVNNTRIAAMVHVAINGIESAETLAMQRQGAFPNHLAEGFRSFWVSTMAAGGVLLGISLLITDAVLKSAKARMVSGCTLAVVLVSLGWFDYWYAFFEFPRLDPDMASAGSPLVWTDVVAGLVLLVGTSFWIAVRTASSSDSGDRPTLSLETNSHFLAAAALLLMASALCHIYYTLSVSFSMLQFLNLLQSTHVLLNVFAQMLVSPTELLEFVLASIALWVLWQTFRRTEFSSQLAPLSGRRFAYYFVAWLALFLVGIPVLKAFAFGYWLGPFVW